MKSIYTLRIALVSLLAVVLFLPGCTDDFEAMNTPDNKLAASELEATSLAQAFSRAQWDGMPSGAGPMHTFQNLNADSYVQYFSHRLVSDQYLETSWIGSGWIYGGAGQMLNFVREFTAENDMPAENAVANIWRVHIYQRLTDVWGPIPYSEIGNGKKVVPYDSQEEVYMDFLQRLPDAVETLKNHRNAQPFGNGDLIYDGDVDKWIKFANSLQLRVAMRISDVEPELARQKAEEAASRDLIESNESNATLQTTPSNRNPYHTLSGWTYFRMSSPMESVLEGMGDPRLSEYHNPAWEGDRDGDGSPYEGMAPGSGPNNPDLLEGAFSDMDTRWLSEEFGGGSNPPWPVMFASEVYFLRAEGALRGWNMGGTAKEFYNEGIRKSMTQERAADGISSEEIEEYLNSEGTPKPPEDMWNLPAMSDIPVKYQENASKERRLEQIITQKWLALYPISPEAFSEMRRTGYPRGYPRTISRNEDGVEADDVWPRWTYEQTGEYNDNPEGVTNAAENLLDGPDKNTTLLWWDVERDHLGEPGDNF